MLIEMMTTTTMMMMMILNVDDDDDDDEDDDNDDDDGGVVDEQEVNQVLQIWTAPGWGSYELRHVLRLSVNILHIVFCILCFWRWI